MDEKGEEGVKNLKKWVTSFMNMSALEESASTLKMWVEQKNVFVITFITVIREQKASFSFSTPLGFFLMQLAYKKSD